MIRIIATGFFCLLLTSCASMPVSTMIKMRNFDPLTANWDQVAVAGRLPDELAVPPGGISVNIIVTVKKSDERLATKLIFNQTTDIRSAFLLKQEIPGTQITIATLRPEDKGVVDEMVAKVKQLKSQYKDKDIDTNFNVAFQFCRKGQAVPDNLRLTTYARPSQTDDFLILFKQMDLQKNFKQKPDLADIPLCKNKPGLRK